MEVTLRYFNNRDTVGIQLHDCKTHVSGAFVSFQRGQHQAAPDFAKQLFDVRGIDRVSLGTGNEIGLGKIGRSKPWKELLPDILVFLRDVFFPGERIFLRDAFVFDRPVSDEDLMVLPEQGPFEQGQDEVQPLLIPQLAILEIQ